MRTKFRLTLSTLITVFLMGVAAYEFVQVINIETQAQSIFSEAEIRSGNDFRTRSIKAVVNSSQDDIATLHSATITKSGLASLVGSLEKTGKTMGLSVSVSSIKSETDIVRIRVDTQGTWGASLAYIHLLESLPYKTSVEETNLSVSGKVWHSSLLLKITLSPEKT